MIVTVERVKEYARIDYEQDEPLIQGLILAAEQYLKNATGKEYPPFDSDGNSIIYPLEELYLFQLVIYWYDNRNLIGKVGEDFSKMTKSLLLQLQTIDHTGIVKERKES